MSEIDPGVILGICGICLTIISLLIQHFKVIADLKERLSKLETKIDLFWKAVEVQVVDMLRAPHSEEYDRLLDKFANKTLTKKEARKLRNHLTHEAKRGSRGKRLAVIFLLARLESELKVNFPEVINNAQKNH